MKIEDLTKNPKQQAMWEIEFKIAEAKKDFEKVKDYLDQLANNKKDDK